MVIDDKQQAFHIICIDRERNFRANETDSLGLRSPCGKQTGHGIGKFLDSASINGCIVESIGICNR